MTPDQVHPMQVEHIADRRTTRYSCPICLRCVEDGPEGISILFRGDPLFSHRAGLFSLEVDDIDSGRPPEAGSSSGLH